MIRSVVTPAKNGGNACSSQREKTESCVKDPCISPVDCVLSPWTNSGSCSVTCGSGTQKMIRSVGIPARNGGNACSSQREKTESCVKDPCRATGVVAWERYNNLCYAGQMSSLTRTYYTQVSIGGGSYGSVGSWGQCRDHCARNANCHMFWSNQIRGGPRTCWNYVLKNARMDSDVAEELTEERRRLPSYREHHQCYWKYGLKWTKAYHVHASSESAVATEGDDDALQGEYVESDVATYGHVYEDLKGENVESAVAIENKRLKKTNAVLSSILRDLENQ